MTRYFERQLEELHVELIKMGSLCEKAISYSAKAILGQTDAVGTVFKTDREIDFKEKEIENLCMSILLHYHPVAGDLRNISAAMKMISDMERIGDQAADIADLSKFVNAKATNIVVNIGDMATNAVRMVTGSVDAFVKEDLNLCKMVINEDDLIDAAFNEVKETLAEQMIKGNLDAKTGLDLLMAAKYFERIGDHAVNIAEWVEFSITGIHRNNEHQALYGEKEQ